MKRILKIVFLVGVIFILISFSANADTGIQKEYIVSYTGDEYLLSGYNEGDLSPIIRTESIGVIAEYLNSLSDSISVLFNAVSIDEDILLNCSDICISGTITLNEDCLLEIIGGKIRAESLTLSFDRGGLVIKDGDFVFRNSEIVSNQTAVIMNYSAGASAYFESGKIVGDSNGSTMLIEMGRVFISDCCVDNPSGAAIINSSTLTLFPQAEINGSMYDIYTKTPITLGGDGGAIFNSIKVKYDKLFEKGTLCCVFYSASPSALRNFAFFDENGIEQPLTYFQSYEGIRETNFGAVYLPYTVDFYFGNTLLSTQHIIDDMYVKAEEAPEVSGYDFVGWRKYGEEEIYDFAKKVNSDFALYAKYRLAPPELSLSSLEFIYDGAEHEFGITKLVHPLAEGSVINYRWYYNGNFYSDAGPKIKLSNVSQSGEYYCVVSFTYGTDTVNTTTPPVSVSIEKMTVPIPSLSAKTYNGVNQIADIFPTSYYTVSNYGGTFVGAYPVVLTLTDSENCKFPGGENTVCVDFKIEKAENYWIEELSVSDIYQGASPSHSAFSRFGDVKFTYSDKIDGGYVASPPIAPGVYYCKAYVDGCDNYTELHSAPMMFRVVEEFISGISIFKMPEKCEYKAFETFVSEGLLLSVTYNSSRVEIIDAEKVAISYQSADNFRYGDTGIIATYLDASVAVPLTVGQAKYDTSSIVFENKTCTYNGNHQTLNYIGVLPVGDDGIPLSASVIGGGINAGVYTVVLAFSTESGNYEIPESIERTLTISPFDSTVVFSDLAFVYDGKEKCPSAYYLDIYGRKIEVDVDGGRSLAGEYTAVAGPNDSNYRLHGVSTAFTILKADYDFSQVTWKRGEYVYDGEEKSVYIEGIPGGVRVIGYSDNAAIDAGKYTARVTFSYDERNYNKPPEMSFDWEIEKAEYNTDCFYFADAEYVYDGLPHYPLLEGQLPCGIDGIPLQYSFLSDATHVSEGSVFVEIMFFTDSKNYKAPEKSGAFVKILPLGVTVDWEGLSFVYDSFSHVPTAHTEFCTVAVLGGKIDAGSYTATAIPLSSDYFIINSTVDYTIEKAENFWTNEIQIGDIYEGRKPTPHAECISGDVVYLYFSYTGEQLPTIPEEPGVYYVKAFSDGSRNYNAITSDLLEFRIIKVVPVSVSVSLKKTEYKAFEVLTGDDIVVTVLNNDGSIVGVPFEQLIISYENAESLRCFDSRVSVSCLGFSETMEITVGKADYDMSGVNWNEEVFVYDGTEKTVSIHGLPEGLYVKEYHGQTGINAGEYLAKAFFNYDSDNYNSPGEVELHWRIEKQTVPLPSIDKLEYNGTVQAPKILSSNLYTATFQNAKNSGVYPIILEISDTDNYQFGNFCDTNVIYYEISPRVVVLKLSDIDKYLFSDMSEPEYELISGSLVDGENLELLFTYTENEVYCKSGNANYLVRVIPGSIIEHKSLSEKATLLMFVTFVLLVLIALAITFFIYKRKDIAHYVYVLKCRLSPTETSSESTAKPALTYEELDELGRMEQSLSVDVDRADSLISDSLAKNLLRKEDIRIESDGRKKRIINVDTLSENFASDERVDVNVLKAKKLIPADTAYIKVLARGMIDKPLKVYANDFSLSAVKMIALSGGEAVKVVTVRKRGGARK